MRRLFEQDSKSSRSWGNITLDGRQSDLLTVVVHPGESPAGTGYGSYHTKENVKKMVAFMQRWLDRRVSIFGRCPECGTYLPARKVRLYTNGERTVGVEDFHRAHTWRGRLKPGWRELLANVCAENHYVEVTEDEAPTPKALRPARLPP